MSVRPIEPGAAHRLFRTHVGHGAHRQSRLGQPVLIRGVHCEGDPEVGHHRLAAEQQDVLWLDVPMHYAVAMGEVERLGHAPADPHGFLHRQRARAPDALAQALAVHHGHGVPEESVGFAGVVHRQDVRVAEPGGDPDLAEEALAQLGAELGVEHLEGNRAVVPQVVRKIDRRHAAPTELAIHAVAIPDGRDKTVENVG